MNLLLQCEFLEALVFFEIQKNIQEGRNITDKIKIDAPNHMVE